MPYYLADGIYPEWHILAKTITEQTNHKQRLYAARQESVRKYVERAFGVLHSRWTNFQCPSLLCYKDEISEVLKACIILHNMVVEHRLDSYTAHMSGEELLGEARARFCCKQRSFTWMRRYILSANNRYPLSDGSWSSVVAARIASIMSKEEYFSLKSDLAEHSWKLFS